MESSPFMSVGGSEPRKQAPMIANADFYPAIDPNDFRASHRITDTITDDRVADALTAAATITNRILEPWRASLAGNPATLDAVMLPKWMPSDGLLALYRRAIYGEAHATLLDRYRDYDATSAGNHDSDSREDMAGKYRQASRWAVSEMTNRPHTTVELI